MFHSPDFFPQKTTTTLKYFSLRVTLFCMALVEQLPPGIRLLAPGVFKPSCSTLFTLFLRPALSTIFHSKNSLHDTSVFSSLLTTYFYLTGHSPVFIYNTAVLYIVLLAHCGHLQRASVCRALHPVSGEDGILVADVPRGVHHASSARTSPRRVVGLAVRLEGSGSGSIRG